MICSQMKRKKPKAKYMRLKMELREIPGPYSGALPNERRQGVKAVLMEA